MASRRLAVPLAYPRREASARGATRIDGHSLILIVGLLALVAFAGVLYLSQASVAAELRYRLADSERRTHDFWEQNLALRREIADLGRLAVVEDRATRLGMVDAPLSGPYVVCIVPPAEQAPPSSTTPRVGAQADQAGGRIWDRLARRLWPVPPTKAEQLAALSP